MALHRDYISDITVEDEHELDPIVMIESASEENSRRKPEEEFVNRNGNGTQQQHPQRGGEAAFLSPFSPEFRKRRRVQSSQTEEGIEVTEVATNGPVALSFNSEHCVSVVIHILNPPPKTSRQEREGRLPCVFPIAAFEKAFSRNDESNPRPQSSPTAIAMTVTSETRNLMVINPTAFGKDVPNKVSIEVLRKIVGRTMSTEDWAREYRFNQVLWPTGTLSGFCRMARAVAQDLVAPASLAHRTVFAYGQIDKKFMLFGDCITDRLAQSYTQPPNTPKGSLDTPDQLEQISQQYGLIGLTLNELLKFKAQQKQTTGIDNIVIGLSMIEITGDERIVDLSEKWGSWRAPANNKTDTTPLRLSYDGVNTGGVLSGIKIHEVSSLKTQGLFFRRAFKIAEPSNRDTQRGHVIATLYLYRNSTHLAHDPKLPVAHFIDLALPNSINLTRNKDSVAAHTRRNATIRKSITTLGAVFRSMILREAGGQVSLSFRESMLTKVLQKSLNHPNGRAILLTSISPMIEEYDKTMEYLRFCNRLVERPGDRPKSPFDHLSRVPNGTIATSPMSLTFSEISDQISLSELDKEYHPSLLQTLTSDARQRLRKAGFQHKSPQRNSVYLASRAEKKAKDNVSQYEQLDPEDYVIYSKSESGTSDDDSKPIDSKPSSSTVKSTSPTPLARNVSTHPELSVQKQIKTPGEIDTTFALDSMEQGSAQSPSPIFTDIGRSSSENQYEIAKVARSLLESSRKEYEEEEMVVNESLGDPPQATDAREDPPELRSKSHQEKFSAPKKIDRSPSSSTAITIPPSVPPSGGDTSDTDSISQIGEMNGSYIQSTEQHRENAEFQESEYDIIKRISAERDSLRIKLDRISKEQELARISHEQEIREMRLASDKNTRELELIAEDAVAENERLGNRITALEMQQKKREADTVPKEVYEQLEFQNQQLDADLNSSRYELGVQRSEISQYERRVIELDALLRSRELEGHDRSQIQQSDEDRINELEEQLRHARLEISRLQAEISRMAGEFAQAQKDFGAREAEWKNKMADADDNLRVLQNELDESISTLNAVHSRCVDLGEKNGQLRKEVMGLEQTCRKKEEENQKLRNEQSELSEQLEARAADLTELTAVAGALEAAKADLNAKLEEESEAKAKYQMVTQGLMEMLAKVPDETKQRLEPLKLQRKQELALKHDLISENEGLTAKNQHLRALVEQMQKNLSESDRWNSRASRGGGHREAPSVCQICRQNSSSTLSSLDVVTRDPSKEKLENLALDLSLIVRHLSSSSSFRGGGGIGLEGFEEHIRATEQITDQLLKTLRQRAWELRQKGLG